VNQVYFLFFCLKSHNFIHMPICYSNQYDFLIFLLVNLFIKCQFQWLQFP